MTKNNFSLFTFPILIISLFLICSCAQETFILPDLKSESIKDYRYLVLKAGHETVINTGVHVEKGNFYSIIVSGNIEVERQTRDQKDKKIGPRAGLGVRIGEKSLKVPPINATLQAQEAGEISVLRNINRSWQIRDGARGGYRITIILWNTNDLDYIADYFKKVELANPEQKHLKGISEQVVSLKTYLYALQPDTELSMKEKKSTEVAANELQMSSKSDENNKSPTKSEEVDTESQITVGINTDTDKKNGDSYSPVMLIVSPRDGQTISSVAIQLIGVVEDDSGLHKVDIFINGKPLSLDQDRGLRVDHGEAIKRYEFNERVAVNSGKNLIKVVAEDVSGRVTEQTMAVNKKDDKGTVWAVVVGVDTYTNLPHLKYAVKDAVAFNDLLLDTNIVSSSNIFLATDKHANLTNLRTILGTELKKRAGQDDLVIIYFAGHGATERDSRSPDGDGVEKYLLPHDADPDNLYATALPMGEISHIISRINSDRLIFIADACYSGASGGRTVPLQGIRSNLSDAFLNRIASGKGRVIMTASGPNEVSVEDDDLQHGVFTYHLMEAMKGKADYDTDGFVTVDEAYRYVSEKVPNATEQQQHPVKKGTVEGQLILSSAN